MPCFPNLFSERKLFILLHLYLYRVEALVFWGLTLNVGIVVSGSLLGVTAENGVYED